MRTFDRIILIMMVLGIWALVLAPQETGAHYEDEAHWCTISGRASGAIEDLSAGGAVSIDVRHLAVNCLHI